MKKEKQTWRDKCFEAGRNCQCVGPCIYAPESFTPLIVTPVKYARGSVYDATGKRLFNVCNPTDELVEELLNIINNQDTLKQRITELEDTIEHLERGEEM